MMSESSAVDCRQDKLEEDNHRLKLTVGALLLVLFLPGATELAVPGCGSKIAM